jgi:transcriptional regulator with XRE-family HTH domain
MINADKVQQEPFKTWFRRMRTECGYTHTQFAQMVGCTDQTVSGWERGIAFPQRAKFPAIAKALGVTVEVVAELCGKEPLPSAPRTHRVVVPIRKDMDESPLNESPRAELIGHKQFLLQKIRETLNSANLTLTGDSLMKAFDRYDELSKEIYNLQANSFEG